MRYCFDVFNSVFCFLEGDGFSSSESEGTITALGLLGGVEIGVLVVALFVPKGVGG